MASVESNSPAVSKEYRTKIIALTALASLVFFVIVDKLASSRRTSDYDARAKRSEALLTAGEQRDKKYDAYIQWLEEDKKRNEAFVKQREEFNARFEKILTTWERQQREYQAYLDSLKTKSH